jgi:DNA-binding CsgD family transcriptional regulator/tetratricopeptide (TPR) repeat protein
VLVSYRDDEVGAEHPLRFVLGDLATAHGCARVHVPPLSAAGVARLAAGHAIEPDHLHRVTNGNPFYVTEVLAAPGWTVPATISDAVLARTARLTPQARDLLEVVSVAPGGLEMAVAETLLLGSERALDECAGSGVLLVFGGRMQFRHELARLAVERAVPEGTKLSLHRRILAALESMPGTDPARLAHHADRAADARRVLRYAPAAARSAALRGAHREAAAQYARALEHAAILDDESAADLLEKRAYECYLVDEITESLDARRSAFQRWEQAGDALRAADQLRWISRLSWFVGRNAESETAAAEAVARLERFGPCRELAMALSNVAHLRMLADDHDGAISWGERAIALADELGEPEILAHALNNVGTSEGRSGDTSRLERSLAISLEHGLEEHVARAYTNLGSLFVQELRLEDASRYLDEGIRYSSERDLDSWRVYMQGWRAQLRLLQGDWDGATQDAERVIAERSPTVSRIMPLVVLGRVRARRGEPDPWSPLDEASALARQTGEMQRLAPVAAARSEALWLHDGEPELDAVLRPAFEQALILGTRSALGELSFWMWRLGELDAVPPGADEPFASQVRGHWKPAAEAWKRIGCPYEQADALVAGDEAAMREALEIFTGLGAGAAADRLRRSMRAAGVTRIPRGPRRATRAAPAQLTRRQLDVLALVEQGLSNAEIAARLFITEKTAGHHVSAILRKLGARSRGEAAAAARKMGITPAETG